MKTAGVIILIVGLFMTVYAGLNWKPNVGIGVMVIGATVLVLGRKYSMAT